MNTATAMTIEERARELLPTLDSVDRIALPHVCRRSGESELPAAVVLRLADQGLVERAGVGKHGRFCRPTDLGRAVFRLLTSEGE
jgi:hypothetical protein